MSKTPIYDFVKKYADEKSVRLHMPAHKGREILGCEMYDITEIVGADSLFEAGGIIHESEINLSRIYGTRASFYSTEGSSLCIRAMIFMAMQYSKNKRKILAGRNAHKSFVSALALCDAEVEWLYGDNLYSCNITPETLESALNERDYFAVYVTSPDYLGNMLDIEALAKVCHKYKVPLIVDNAHGAYLKFLGQHPIDLGADMCCDSAHKTLPCLTGAAYLHVSESASFPYEKSAKQAMSLFASTSPSYLILASMDKANEAMLCGEFETQLRNACRMCDEFKTELSHLGIAFSSKEKLKVNIKPKSVGYMGNELGCLMENSGIIPEFYDKDNLVLMFSPCNDDNDFERLSVFFRNLSKKQPIEEFPPSVLPLERKISIRQAAFSSHKCIPPKDAHGKILGSATVSCPPAIPIAVCGELLNDDAIVCFEYYGINEVWVVEQ